MSDLVESPCFEAVTGSRFIDAGCDGTVYRLTSDLVAKFPLRLDQWDPHNFPKRRNLVERATSEYEITRLAHAAGISVPRPEGVFCLNVSGSQVSYRDVPAFVMQYIDGIRLSDCWDDDDKRARQLRDEELMKAESLGFKSGDFRNPANSIYCPKEDKIVLIDLAKWRKENE